MGYCTTFKLSSDNSNISELNEELNVLTQYYFKDEGDELVLYEAKWYDFAKNMESLTKKYPERHFTLRGNGEEHGDVWCQYWQNGKYEEHRQQEFVPPPATIFK